MSKETKQLVIKEIRKLRAKAKRKQYEADRATEQANKLAEDNEIVEENYSIDI